MHSTTAEQVAPRPGQHERSPRSAGAPPSIFAAGRPPLSEAGLAILDARGPFVDAERFWRSRVDFYELHPDGQDHARWLSEARTERADAVNALALWDIANLTDEVRARLTFHGVSFTSSTAALRQAAE